MLNDSMPSELRPPWMALRLVSLAMLVSPVVYVVIMAVLVSGLSEGSQSLLDWTGVAEDSLRESRVVILGALMMNGIILFVAAFAVHGHLLRRPGSDAFARFRIAKLVGLGIAEAIGLLGFVSFLLFGGFLRTAAPFLAVSLAAMIALFPTEMQLIAHLDESRERAGKSGAD